MLDFDIYGGGENYFDSFSQLAAETDTEGSEQIKNYTAPDGTEYKVTYPPMSDEVFKVQEAKVKTKIGIPSEAQSAK